MRGNFSARVTNLLQGFWLIPGLIALVMAALALLVVDFDRGEVSLPFQFIFDGDATAARGILSTIAGSLITVAGVTFSLTLVTLQLVSSQFTPRALGNFLRDRITQVTIGTFIGIFLYSLLVLRSVRTEGEEKTGFVPELAVTLSIVLAVVAVVFLLVFLHHMARSIQVSNITAAIARQTLARISVMYPEHYGKPVDADASRLVASWYEDAEPVVIHADRPGYVQAIDVADLVDAVGAQPETRLIVHVTPGDFITPRDRLISAWSIVRRMTTTFRETSTRRSGSITSVTSTRIPVTGSDSSPI